MEQNRREDWSAGLVEWRKRALRDDNEDDITETPNGETITTNDMRRTTLGSDAVKRTIERGL